MNCPSCDSSRTLQVETVSSGLRCRECPECHGRWLRSDDYWRWRSRDPEPGVSPTESPSGEDGTGLRWCPEDGYLLARFHVGPPHGFSIEQCRTCSGVWFDRGEWEALLEGGLVLRLNHILSEEWQDELRAQRRASLEEEQWERQLGRESLQRIREIKEWLDSHPKRSELYAFLRFHERAV